MNPLDEIIKANRFDGGPALPSVCSAHPDVLAASLLLAEHLDRRLLIEATSNQVNQHGGYTGQTPARFIAGVRALARTHGVAAERLLFGGDHLGTQAWKSLPADDAMVEAEAMIGAYVKAGFTKIHLDCSEGCAGEPATLSDGPAATRAARLAGAAENAADDPEALRYIVGTEVPPPGGARRDDEPIKATPPARAIATLDAHADAFAKQGLQAAFARVRGLVLQPGLEFAPEHVEHFRRDSPDHLSAMLTDHSALCFEAHSTDYQHPSVHADLARRNFAILKVGPALTFAWREALYALSHIDLWYNGGAHVAEVMEAIMLEDTSGWNTHYHGDETRRRIMRHFSYADRIRYYWAHPEAIKAVDALKRRIDRCALPTPLLEQYLPAETLEIADGLSLSPAMNLLLAHVQRALHPYFRTAL